MRDYYEILGVEKTASADAIKTAYKKLALKCHPDRNPGPEAEAQFKEASEAFEVLADPDKRARYDRFGHEGVKGMAHHYSSVDDIFGSSTFADILGDLFGGIFGGGMGGAGRGGQRGGRRGAHIRARVAIDLEDTLVETTKTLVMKRREHCIYCGGQGINPGARGQNCQTCGGHGVVLQQAGFITIQTTCPRCQGEGRSFADKDHCEHCEGTGHDTKEVEVEVRIPPGITDSTQIRIRDQGEPGDNGGPRGDLFVEVGVREHALFERRDEQLYLRLPVSYSQAALGATVEVPKLGGGTLKLKIPKGTQPGTVETIKGEGVPSLHGGRHGDLHVLVTIDVPKKLAKEHDKLIKQLAEIEDKTVTEERRRFLDAMVAYESAIEGKRK